MRRVRWAFLLFSLFFFLFFYLFSRQVKLETFKQINFDTSVRLQDKIPERFGEMFEDAGFLIAPAPSVILVFAITGLGFFVRKGWKKKLAVVVIPLAFGLLVGAEVYGKMKVESPAPPFFMLKNPTTIFPTYHVQEQYSYPSGHAARSVFLSMSLLGVSFPIFRKRLRAFVFLTLSLFLFILFISIGKVYLGHHWASDILGGWILGGASFFFELAVLADSSWLRFVRQIRALVFDNKQT